MTRKFLVDLVERVIWTFLQGFAGAWIVTVKFSVLDLKVAALAGTISTAKCFISANVGNRNSASSAPSV